MKAERRLIIEKTTETIARRDVFGQLPIGYVYGKFNLSVATVAWRAKGYEFPANPWVVVNISPLISIVEDQVKYLGSLGIKAGCVVESKTSD